jgi:large subunit ribosomal protein L15
MPLSFPLKVIRMALQPPYFRMLHSLRPASGSTKRRKRVARGNSAGGGTTAGRGTKGQHARTGKGKRFGFEGGQVPLIRRQPKLGGFTPPRKKTYEVINISVLEKNLEAGSYTVADLAKKRLVRNGKLVKILANGEITKKFEIEAHSASKAAKEAVKKAGGSITLVKA